MNFFESMRRANLDFYTASPLEFLSAHQLAELAQQQGMTVEELQAHLSTPHPEMTCPLCGRASTHLVGCKGCGGDAFGFELEEAYGAAAKSRLKEALTLSLRTKGEAAGVVWSAEQIGHAVSHAYQMGGCMICADCFSHTLPTDAYRTCPLYLHHERTLEAGRGIPFHALLLAVFNGEQAGEWVTRMFRPWCEIWHTGYSSEEEQQAIAAWRATILHGALDQPEEWGQRTKAINAELEGILRALGITEATNYEDDDGGCTGCADDVHEGG